jgi:hypothetical protein
MYGGFQPYSDSSRSWEQTSGVPYGGQPTSPPALTDSYGLPARPATDPLSPAEPGTPPYVRRITPSPPPQRGKLVMGLVIGLVAGLVAFGTAGFFVGRGSGGGSPVVTAGPTPVPSFVAGLVAINQSKLTGELATLGKPWLADMSGCLAESDPGGPKLGKGEARHVLCRDGGMYVHFVTYASADEKASVRSYRQQLALGAAAIMAGSEQPGRKLGGVSGAPGTYIEYATRGANSPALCGVWWDLDNTASGVYVDVLCGSLGGTWDPLRAVWQLHS